MFEGFFVDGAFGDAAQGVAAAEDGQQLVAGVDGDGVGDADLARFLEVGDPQQALDGAGAQDLLEQPGMGQAESAGFTATAF